MLPACTQTCETVWIVGSKSVQNGIKKYEEQLSATHKKIGDMARGATEQDAEYANQIKKLGLPKVRLCASDVCP